MQNVKTQHSEGQDGTGLLTGLALSPKVQVEIQVLHHVRQLVVFGIFSELNTDNTRSALSRFCNNEVANRKKNKMESLFVQTDI